MSVTDHQTFKWAGLGISIETTTKNQNYFGYLTWLA